MVKMDLPAVWSMHTLGAEDWQEAIVPGTVYTDLLRNKTMEDPFWKDNADRALARMESDYEYVTEFDCTDEIFDCDEIILRFDGIDTLAEVYVNGRLAGNASNMHRIWEFPVKEQVGRGKNKLSVILRSPLKYIRKRFAESPVKGSEDALDGFVHLRKAHCMFGWDWGAHLPDAGIFRKVSLIGNSGVRIREVRLNQIHEGVKPHENGQVVLELKVMTRASSQETCSDGQKMCPDYQVVLTDPSGGETFYENSPTKIIVKNPKLWWPNGLGEQPLYRIRVELADQAGNGEVWEKKIGLRTLGIRREQDEWGESFAHEINGKTVFAMGADYIPEDHLLGRTSKERTRRLLEDAKAANFNTIRVWGGGYYPEDWFFDLCDELGLLVWQDFMFACGLYELTPEFEENIVQEFIDNIIRIRDHASLALWCGNNEMEMFAGQGTWVSDPSEIRDYLFMYERIIPQVLKEYDPHHFYWPASPSSGGSFDKPNDENRGDVHYWDVWHGNKPFTEYRKFYFRYVSEFGFQSFPCVNTVKTFAEPEDFNIFSYVMEKHQRNGSANGKILNYMQQTYKYPTSFELVLYASQLLQADAIRYGVEHFRRNRGRCMGAVYWQLNDCWPVASWSSIDYTGRWKALHYFARRFFAPIMISCEEEGWLTQETSMNWEHFDVKKSIRLNVANETLKDETLDVIWAVRDAYGKVLREERVKLSVDALSSCWLEKEELQDLDEWNEYVSYEVRRDDELLSCGTVIFSLPKYFKYRDPSLSCEVSGDEIIIRSSAYARGVEVQNEDETLILSDNYFDMNGGEKSVRILRGNPKELRVKSVFDIR